MLEQNLTIPVEVSRTKTKCFIYFSTWLPHGNKMDTLLVQYQFSVSKTPVWTQNHINTRKVFPKIDCQPPPPPLPEPSLIWSIKPYSDICKISHFQYKMGNESGGKMANRTWKCGDLTWKCSIYGKGLYTLKTDVRFHIFFIWMMGSIGILILDAGFHLIFSLDAGFQGWPA